MKTSDTIHDLKKIIDEKTQFTLITHQNPDGDAIGSLLAMYHFLNSLPHKKINLFVPDDYPDFLSWMPGCEKIIICDTTKNEIKEIIESSEIIICLDFNHTSRIACLRDSVLQSKAIKILIDHHPHPENIAHYLFSQTNVSSTSELLYKIITSLGGMITKDIAACLFTGIMTDTGGFSHNSSNYGTYEILAQLLKTGIDKNFIYDKVYNNFSADRMRLMGYCLHEKMKFFPEYKTAYISLSKKDLKDFHFNTGDTEGFVNLPLSIKGVIFSALFIEKDDMIKTSFRSKGHFPVNKISKEHFNGGGHINAAGGEYYDTLEKTLEYFVSILPLYKKQIDQA